MNGNPASGPFSILDIPLATRLRPAWATAIGCTARQSGAACVAAAAMAAFSWRYVERPVRDVALAIGGPDGHAPFLLERASARWSLSPLTLPHGLVRVVIAEQLYRAHSILEGHPYHRA